MWDPVKSEEAGHVSVADEGLAASASGDTRVGTNGTTPSRPLANEEGRGNGRIEKNFSLLFFRLKGTR
jgi:hypothetical protein